jgi:hypothetical protein
MFCNFYLTKSNKIINNSATTETWGLYYKTLRIRNLRDKNKFRSKPVSSGSDKHANLDEQTH